MGMFNKVTLVYSDTPQIVVFIPLEGVIDALVLLDGQFASNRLCGR